MRYKAIYKNGNVIAEFMDGKCTFRSCEYLENGERSAYIMPDIKPYKSMIDGSEITSRSKHREHLRAHNCVEIGNETKYLKPRVAQAPPGLKETVARIAYEKLTYGKR